MVAVIVRVSPRTGAPGVVVKVIVGICGPTVIGTTALAPLR